MLDIIIICAFLGSINRMYTHRVTLCNTCTFDVNIVLLPPFETTRKRGVCLKIHMQDKRKKASK